TLRTKRDCRTLRMNTLAIIIVNYRTPELTLDCLQSLHTPAAQPRMEYRLQPSEPRQRPRILIIDNASGDQSLSILQSAIHKEGWQESVTIITSSENRGFAAGNNL